MKMITERLKFADVFPDKAATVAQRLHIKKDEIPFVRKYYTAEKDKSEVNKKERAVVSYISTGIKDRDGEMLIPEGVLLDNYQKNPVVPFAHNYKTLPPAKNMWIKRDEKGLVAKTVFAKSQKAEEYYQAYTEDIGGTGPLLNAFSVGFIPLEWEDTDTKALEKNPDLPKRIYNKWELLEYSLVPIPSCAEALTIAVEKEMFSKKLLKELEIEVVKDVPDREIEVEKDEEKSDTEKKLLNPTIGDKIKDSSTGEIIEWNGKDWTPVIREVEVEIEVDKVKGIKVGWVDEKEIAEEAKKKEEAFIHGDPNAKDNIVGVIDRGKGGILDILGNELTVEEIKQRMTTKPQYKERWNRSLSKLFDIERVESKPSTFNYAILEKFLECNVKQIFQNSYTIPSPLLGTYLTGFKEILKGFDLKDTRNFNSYGAESPLQSEVIKLNSTKSDDFLICGTRFYDAGGTPLVIDYSPTWYGIRVSISTSNENKGWNKELLEKVHDWVQENNFLKGEKFALSGDFLDEPEDGWDSLVMDEKMKDSINKTTNVLIKKKEKATGRGLLFIGPAGTGKTKTGRVLMNEVDSTFIWVSSRDFGRVGSLGGLALAFSLARDLAPTVLFIEDVDTWLGNRNNSAVDLIKTELDGIRQNRGVVTVLTSNFPEKLPDALLDRPGRFHHIINFELPDASKRTEMLKMWAGDIEESLLKEIAGKTDGFSGAHLKELVEFAKMIAEEDDVEIGKALMMSLEKLMEQRELIDDIRANKVDAKSFWSRIKLIEGKIQVPEEIDSLRDPVSKELNEVKDEDREVQLSEEEKGVLYTGGFMSKEMAVDILKASHKELIQEKNDHIADLKAGRVLSRKNRNIVKDAITALNAVLKADATGTQEDDEAEEGGKVTERTVELVKDGDKKTFAVKDIEFLVEGLVEKKAKKMLEDSFEKQSDPEIIKKRVLETIKLEIDKRKGRVR